MEVASSDRNGGRTSVHTKTGLQLFVPYIENPVREPLQVRISADEILIGTQKPKGISAANVFPGTIRKIESIKGQAVLTVNAGDTFYVRLTFSAVANLGLKEGVIVFLIIKARSFRLL